MSMLAEALASRDLLRNLVTRELKASYKGSALGFFWSLLNPLVTMLIFTVVFAFFLRIVPPAPASGGSRNFAAYLLIALLPWNLVSVSMSTGASSLVSNGNLIRKVYFFRAALPASSVLANGVNFLLSLIPLMLLLGVLGIHFWPALWLLPVPLLALLALCIGLSMLTAVANLYFRDTQYLIGLVLMAWFYATPIIYPITYVESYVPSKIPEWALTLYRANPATALFQSFRAILYDGRIPSPFDLGWALLSAFGVLAIGLRVFRRAEPHFAEEV